MTSVEAAAAVAPARRRAWGWPLAAAALCLAFTATQFHLAGQRRVLLDPDQSDVLYRSIRMFQALRQGESRAFLRDWSWSDQWPGRPPLMSSLMLPFYALAGLRENALLAASLLMRMLLSLYVFKLAARFYGPGPATGAVVIVNTFPLAWIYSNFFPDAPLAILVTAWVWHLTSSDGLRERRQTSVLGLILGLGLLAKVIFPLFIAGPTWIYLRSEKRSDDARDRRRRLSAAAGMIAIGAFVALTWYGVNGWKALREAAQGSSEKHGVYAGSPLSPLSIAGYFIAMARHGLGSHYVLALLILSAASLRAGAARDGGSKMLWTWLLTPMAVLSLFPNKELRYAAPALPAAAILLAGILGQTTRRFRLGGVLAVLLLLVYPVDRLLARYMDWSLFPHRPKKDKVGAAPYDALKIVHLLRAVSERADGARLRTLVAFWSPQHHSTALNYLDAWTGGRNEFENMGTVLPRLHMLDGRRLTHVIAFERFPAGSLTWGSVNAEITRRLDAPDSPLKFLRRIRLEKGGIARLYGLAERELRRRQAPSRAAQPNGQARR